jgi:hypothetical protein
MEDISNRKKSEYSFYQNDNDQSLYASLYVSFIVILALFILYIIEIMQIFVNIYRSIYNFDINRNIIRIRFKSFYI